MSELPAHDCPTTVKSEKIRRHSKGLRTTINQIWAGEADCLHCALRTSVLFAGLTQAEFELIYNHITQFNLLPGESIYRAGDPIYSLFTVRNGLIKHLRLLPDGTQRVLRLSSKADVLGLEALVLDTYQNDAIALYASEICGLPAKIIRQLAKDNPILHQALMRHWQAALNAADAWIVDLSTGSARARVARLLLKLASAENQGRCVLVSREDMGAMLGITTETASRTIAEFKRHKLVSETVLNQCYLDVDQLKDIAEE